MSVAFVGGSLDGKELPVPMDDDGSLQPQIRVGDTGEVYEIRYSRMAIGARGTEYQDLRYELR